MEKVSIIVPVFNVERYLEQCITSIANQSYSNLEIILIDDGSTDSSGGICDNWAQKDERVVVIHQLNRGLSCARNKGLEIASGDLICFVDSDDFIEKEYVTTLYKCYKESDADMVICMGRRVNSEGIPYEPSTPAPRKCNSLLTEEDFWDEYARNMYFIVVWSKLYKKSVFNNIRFPEGEINEDEAILWKIVAACHRVYCTDAVEYNYRIHGTSVMRSPFSKKNLSLAGRLLEEIDYLKGANISEATKLNVERYAFWKGCTVLKKGYQILYKTDIEAKHQLDELHRKYVETAKWLSKRNGETGLKALLRRIRIRLFAINKNLYFATIN